MRRVYTDRHRRLSCEGRPVPPGPARSGGFGVAQESGSRESTSFSSRSLLESPAFASSPTISAADSTSSAPPGGVRRRSPRRPRTRSPAVAPRRASRPIASVVARLSSRACPPCFSRLAVSSHARGSRCSRLPSRGRCLSRRSLLAGACCHSPPGPGLWMTQRPSRGRPTGAPRRAEGSLAGGACAEGSAGRSSRPRRSWAVPAPASHRSSPTSCLNRSLQEHLRNPRRSRGRRVSMWAGRTLRSVVTLGGPRPYVRHAVSQPESGGSHQRSPTG